MSLAVTYLIWFGYISRLSQWEGEAFLLAQLFLPAFAAATGGGWKGGSSNYLPLPPHQRICKVQRFFQGFYVSPLPLSPSPPPAPLQHLSSKRSETQAVIGKAVSSFLKRVTGRIFTIRSDFIEAIRNFILDALLQKTAKNGENHQYAYQKHCFDVWGLQNIHLVTQREYYWWTEWEIPPLPPPPKDAAVCLSPFLICFCGKYGRVLPIFPTLQFHFLNRVTRGETGTRQSPSF